MPKNADLTLSYWESSDSGPQRLRISRRWENIPTRHFLTVGDSTKASSSVDSVGETTTAWNAFHSDDVSG